MKYKFVLLILALLIINVVHAQWHFTVTSMNYNDNCSGNAPIVQAEIEVAIRIQLANDLASKTYTTKEECESMRSSATMNWSSGGCYIRTTTSPCIGGNIGGGGDDGGGSTGSGIGGVHNNGSLYSNIAIGEPYFSPNEAQATSSLGRDMEIKLEALNNGYNNAVRGIKTGDTSFDDLYKRLSNTVITDDNSDVYTFSTRKEIDPNMSLFVNVKDREKVNLGKDNEYNNDDEDVIVPIDPERIKNQERDEKLEKSKKRIDSTLIAKNKRIDSILRSRGAIISKDYYNDKDDNWIDVFSEAFFDVTSATYNVLTDAVMFANDGVKMYELLYDVKVPCSDRLSELEDYLVNSKDVFTASLVGNITDAAKTVSEQIVVKLIEPTSEVIGGTVTTGSNTITTIINSLSAGNLVRSTYSDAVKTNLNTIQFVFNGGDPNKPYGELNKKLFNYGRDVAKEIYDRNKVRELIKVKDDEKK